MGIVSVLIALIVTFVIMLAYVVFQTYKKQGHERVHYLVNTMLKLAIVVLIVGLAIVFVIDHFETISDHLYLIFMKEEIDEFRVVLKTVFGTRSVFFALQVMLSACYLVLAFILISLFSFVVAVATRRIFNKVLTVEKVLLAETVSIRNERQQHKIFLMTRKLRL